MGLDVPNLLCTMYLFSNQSLTQVSQGGKRKKDEVSVDSLDFNRKILHTAWHPKDRIVAVAATNNLYIFEGNSNAAVHPR